MDVITDRQNSQFIVLIQSAARYGGNQLVLLYINILIFIDQNITVACQ